MIEVLDPGFFSSIQDLGRYGYRSYGVPTSGALDTIALKQANMLLQNDANAAVIEMTLIGAKVKFLNATVISITGANMSPKLNDIPIVNNRRIPVKPNDILSFSKALKGVRCYLAVKGGLQVSSVLNSRSFYEVITPTYKLKKGQLLSISADEKQESAHSSHVILSNSYLDSNILFVYRGPEYSKLNETQKQLLEHNTFTVGTNNRMAYTLQEELPNTFSGIITSSVFPGTVQLTPSGRMIILMNDCQTTGGYPRILQLTVSAITILSQKRSNDSISFKILD